MGRSRNALEVANQVAFIVACLALSGFVISKLLGGGTSEPAEVAATPNAPYQIGDEVMPFDGAPFSTSPASIVLIVRSSCVFCTQSMDFYRRVSLTRAATGVQIIAAAPEPVETLEQYLRTHEFGVDHLRQLPNTGYKAKSTPTLVLVNRDGRVISSFQGQLNSAQEDAFLESLELGPSGQRN